MKIIYTSLAILLSLSAQARAEGVYAVTCGDGREKGFEHAELALVDDYTASIRIYREGKAIPDDQVDMGNTSDGWLMTVHGEGGKEDRQYAFSEAKKNVQELLVQENGKKKKLGKPLPCNFPEL